MIIHKNIQLSDKSTFGLRATAKYYVECADSNDMYDISNFIDELALPSFTLGGGSNTLFCSDYPGIIVKLTSQEIQRLGTTKISVDAGCNLDALISWTIANNLSGLEALSGIPGTVGGAVALNAGAYGQSIKDTLYNVTLYNTHTRQTYTYETADLHYWHRSSIFRDKRGQNLLILRAVFKLHPKFKLPEHPKIDVLKDNDKSTAISLRKAVLKLRSHFPDPTLKHNAGSFFLNPTITKQKADQLRTKYHDIAARPYDLRHEQVSAGWLLESAGFKGTRIGSFYFHKKHANMVINESPSTTGKEVAEFIETVQLKIAEKFGISIVAEPLLIGEEFWQGTFKAPTLKNPVLL